MQDGDLLSVGQSILIPLSADTPQSTATLSPTPRPPTFTPEAGYPAPAPLTPADGSTLRGSDPVLLSWTSVGVLADDEWYVATLRSAGTGILLPPYWTKATSWRLPADYHATDPDASDYIWQVQVVRGKPDDVSDQRVRISPPSPDRHFTWK